jgi:hypothetical protein
MSHKLSVEVRNVSSFIQIEREVECYRLLKQFERLKCEFVKARQRVTKLKQKMDALLVLFENKKELFARPKPMLLCNSCGYVREVQPIVRPAGDTISACLQCTHTCDVCYESYIEEDRYLHCLCTL